MNKLSIVLISIIVILATALGIVTYNYSQQKKIDISNSETILNQADTKYQLYVRINNLEKNLKGLE